MNKDYYIDLIKKQKLITSGENNESVDGSGWYPSVRENDVSKIYSFIKEEMPYIDWQNVNTLDIGTGLGYLPKCLNEMGVKCLGIEGSSDLIDKFVSNEIVIWDFITPLESLNLPFGHENLKDLFDVSFSFEVIEHISPSDQCAFWNNIFTTSKYHVCSIHVEGGTNEYHKCIQFEQKWIDFFEENNIKIIKNIPRSQWVEQVISWWQYSIFFILSK